MSDTAISVQNLSKSYLVGHNSVKAERYTALRDVIANNARNLARKTRDMINGKAIVQGDEVEEFWALKDLSFEVKQGDRVGIIGRNGAGKSTLLKILSRITEPTAGRIKLNGRVASLLEVGTGFHPELTGRENIFLNGAILGMSRSEIQRKFDEIVAFAEVEKFLDTPVKRYSSGMYVRLAFAVAAHLEPEILVVDEVLAVGDAEFQNKCLGKMDQVSREGRTVLFVSHNMDAIERLCGRVIVIQKGAIIENSNLVGKVLKTYLYGTATFNENACWQKSNNQISNPYFNLNYFRLADERGNTSSTIIGNDIDTDIEIQFNVAVPDKSLNIGYSVYSEDGKVVYWSCSTDSISENWPRLKKGENLLVTKIPKHFLNEGEYIIEVMASLHSRQRILEPGKSNCSIKFKISGGLSDSPYWYAKRPGVVAPVMNWYSRN